jgi:hypothetical protein
VTASRATSTRSTHAAHASPTCGRLR